MYDLLLVVLGLPLSIWAVYRLSEVLERTLRMPSIISAAIYIYAFFFECFSGAVRLFEVGVSKGGAGDTRIVFGASPPERVASDYDGPCRCHSLRRGENFFHELVYRQRTATPPLSSLSCISNA